MTSGFRADDDEDGWKRRIPASIATPALTVRMKTKFPIYFVALLAH